MVPSFLQPLLPDKVVFAPRKASEVNFPSMWLEYNLRLWLVGKVREHAFESFP